MRQVSETTEILEALQAGSPGAADQLMRLVYDELHRIAANYLRKENAGHILQPTALVNEAFLKLIDQTRVNWKGKSHFLAVGAQAMRRILVDHARAAKRQKRGGGALRVGLFDEMALTTDNIEDVLAVDDALAKLETVDQRQSQIVELRFFGGLTVEQVADVIGVSKRTVENEWRMVRAWLRRELSEDGQA